MHSTRKPQSFYGRLSEVTSHRYSVFVRYKAVSSAYDQGEGITQGYEYQDVGVAGGHLGGYLPHCF